MPMADGKRAVLIAGPTASGKSALALRLAQRQGGVIVNADSMQVYDGLRILTARPEPDDLARAEHRLYGHVSPSRRYSTGAYLRDVHKMLADPALADRPLVFVGGTGLYFKALAEGVAEIPNVPDDLVAVTAKEVGGLDREERAALLHRHDPQMAVRLLEPDPQRVVRALSVLRATGRSLADWQAETPDAPLSGWTLDRYVLDPGREIVRDRIAARFAKMTETGAIEEVEALMAMGLAPDLPAMKAIGVREIAEFLAGTLSHEEAMARAIIATHQYAKRQRTWFRHHMKAWEWIEIIVLAWPLAMPVR